MGSRTYDFLGDSFLFNDSLIREEFRTVSEADLSRELLRYREFCLSVTPEIEQEILLNKSNLKLFSGIPKQLDISLLKQSAFYVHQHVLYDPLFSLTLAPSEQGKVFSKFMEMDYPKTEKTDISRVMRYLKALTPMIAANYVKLLPTSFFLNLLLNSLSIILKMVLLSVSLSHCMIFFTSTLLSNQGESTKRQ